MAFYLAVLRLQNYWNRKFIFGVFYGGKTVNERVDMFFFLQFEPEVRYVGGNDNTNLLRMYNWTCYRFFAAYHFPSIFGNVLCPYVHGWTDDLYVIYVFYFVGCIFKNHLIYYFWYGIFRLFNQKQTREIYKNKNLTSGIDFYVTSTFRSFVY